VYLILKSKNLSWKEGINRFSAMTIEEKRKFFGRTANDKKKFVSLHSSSENTVKSVSSLPESVDWRTAGTLLKISCAM